MKQVHRIILKYSKRSYTLGMSRILIEIFFPQIRGRLLQINSLSSRWQVILRDGHIDESTCKYRDKIVPCLQIIRPMKMISMLAPCYILYTGNDISTFRSLSDFIDNELMLDTFSM